jgi:hypothetical protein
MAPVSSLDEPNGLEFAPKGLVKPELDMLKGSTPKTSDRAVWITLRSAKPNVREMFMMEDRCGELVGTYLQPR